MSEIKRVQLLPLGTQKEPSKSSKEARKTVRIIVVLPESTEDTFPEYNYKDELAAAKKSDKCKESSSLPNGFTHPDGLEDGDDDDVKRIAKQMEEKYGTGVSLNKKKRKGRKDEYADIGMGYDESDSFIDNTDGYDEMVPHKITTLHGGFYINSGALEFKTDDEAKSDLSSSSSDEDSPKKSARRKRVLESSDETDRENKTESTEQANEGLKKRKLQNGENGLQRPLKKKLLGQDNIYVKKKRPLDTQKKTVKELLREKRVDLDMSIPLDVTAEVVDVDGATSKENTTKKHMSIANITDSIESVVKASSEELAKKKDKVEVTTKDMDVKIAVINSSSNGESSHDVVHNKSKLDVKLPENLSPDIVEIITAIKNAASKYPEAKITHLPSEIRILMLRLERKNKCLGKPSKMKVYEHLAFSLNCKKEQLISLLKKLILEDEQKRVKELLLSLHKEIGKVMPGLLENHEKESKKVLERRSAQENADNDDGKSMRMPKRRFQWNDITKKLLKDILMLKKRCLMLENREDLDKRMLDFLKSDIQVLWPDGWMSMNALNKIYTTYADSKRLGNNAPSSSNATAAAPQPKPPIASSSTNLLKHLPQSFNNSSLSITPIVQPIKDATSSNKVNVSNVVGVNKSGGSNADVTINLSTKPPLPEQPPVNKSPVTCDIVNSPPPLKKDTEGKVRLKPQSELLKPPSVVSHLNRKSAPESSSLSLIDGGSSLSVNSAPKLERISPPSAAAAPKERFSPHRDKSHVSPRPDHFSPPHQDKAHTVHQDDAYQVIDLSDKHESKASKNQQARRDFADIVKETTISPLNSLMSESRTHVGKHHDISITPAYPKMPPKVEHTAKPKASCAGDDIQKVMENLKVLQKMSSPKKCVDGSPTSSAVSVIAVNKSFAPKTASQLPPSLPQSSSSVHAQPSGSSATTASVTQRIDYKTNSNSSTDYGTSFQDEFQKQLYNAFSNLSSNTNKTAGYNSLDRFSHMSAPNMVTSDKYFQNSNNNYAQSSNGHKSTTSTPQSGTYSVFDDMFANLLTQYGYPKEATISKPQQK